MTDTPQHIYDLQLQLWLSKPPIERLRQLMMDNAALYKFLDNTIALTTYSEKVIVTKYPETGEIINH